MRKYFELSLVINNISRVPLNSEIYGVAILECLQARTFNELLIMILIFIAYP